MPRFGFVASGQRDPMRTLKHQRLTSGIRSDQATNTVEEVLFQQQQGFHDFNTFSFNNFMNG